METREYQRLYELEDELWWFVGMRAMSLALLSRFGPETGTPRILDVGCGTGGMLPSLARLGRVVGLEPSEEGLRFARRRGATLVRAALPALPFASGSFDLVTSFDVLYHQGVENDEAGLAEMARVLRPGGTLVLRVPAHDWLRGSHDAAVHTRHRYARRELIAKIRGAGLDPVHDTYANCCLFPLAVLKRWIETARRSESDLRALPAPINRLLAGVLRIEARVAGFARLPFGLSLMAVALKNKAQRTAPAKAPRAMRARDHPID